MNVEYPNQQLKHGFQHWKIVLLHFSFNLITRTSVKRIVKTPKLYFYDTGLLCYLLKIKEDEQNDSGGKGRKESLTEAEMDWKQQKELASLQRKKENEIKELETKIQEWEKTIEELEIQLIAPENSSNSGKLNELHTKYEHAKQTLDDLYEEWEINSLE